MIKVILWIAFLVLVIVAVPIATIWALNTLFLLEIPTTIKTWSATIILVGLLTNSGGKK